MLSNEEMEKIIYDCELSIRNDRNQEAIIMGDYLDILKGYNPYHHSSVYIIRSENTDKVYVGSTTLKLEKRLKSHEKDYKYYKKNGKGKKNMSSFLLLENGDYKIELLESVCCENIYELRDYEAVWMRIFRHLILNKRIEGRTEKEYRNDNKNKIKEEKKNYYEKNKKEIREKQKIYAENNENLKKYYKKYNEEHREENKEYQKEYREKNKEKVKEQQKKSYLKRKMKAKQTQEQT